MTRGPHDSPRWCSTCEAWGDHHSDRHESPDATDSPQGSAA